MERNTTSSSMEMPSRSKVLRPVCWTFGALIAATILLFLPEVVSAETADEAPASIPTIKTVWNLRYSDAAGNAGLCDLYVPILPDDQLQGHTVPLPVDQAPHSVNQTNAKCVCDGLQPSRIPIQVSGKLRPAVIAIHGGGWVTGDKWTLRTYSKRISQLGVCVININYRFAPQHPFPAQVDDVRAALLYLCDHAEQLSVDVNRIGLFGYSAGGHLSALIGVLDDEPDATQASASEWETDDQRWQRLPRVAAVCAGGPPCDFQTIPQDSPALAYFLKGSPREYPDLYRVASPISHVSAGDPPAQLFHGETDWLVPLSNSRAFSQALTDAGVKSQLTVIKDHGHMVTLMSPITRKTVLDFFRQQFFLALP